MQKLERRFFKRTHVALVYREDGLSFQQIGGVLGVTRERARQMAHEGANVRLRLMANPYFLSCLQGIIEDGG
jgi:hypothetical protein